MADRITPAELKFERLFDAPVDLVWRYIVDPELRARWFMGGAIDPRPGGAIEMVMDHRNLSDGPSETPEKYRPFIGTRWTERIIAIDPPRSIAFTWDEGKSGEVTIMLHAEGQRTRLVLHHTGLNGRDDAVNFGGGWLSHLAVLERRVAQAPVDDFWALHAAAEAAVADGLGAA